MKKLLIIFSCILMLFAIVACNQSGPEVKPDAFEEANQAIPSSSTDMTNAKVVAEDKPTVDAFTADFAKAQTQVMSNSVVGQIIDASGSEEGIDWIGILNYILGNGSSKAPSENSPVGIVFKAGKLSLGCDELVLENENEKDEKGETVKYVFSGILVTATPSEGGIISIEVQLDLNGEAISGKVSGKIVIDEVDGPTFEIEVAEGTISQQIERIEKIIDSTSFYSAKDIKIGAINLGVDLFATVSETISIPVSVSVNGSIVLSMKTDENGTLSSISVKVDSLEAKVEAGVFGNAFVSIKELNFEFVVDGFSISLSVSEVSLSGTLLPKMDNIRLKAKMRNFGLNSAGIIAIDSMEATVLGYENISVAAKIEGFHADTSTEEGLISFDFAAAVSFEDQTVGIRGEWGNSELDGPIIIAVLNGTPVTPDSLIDLVMGNINGTV